MKTNVITCPYCGTKYTTFQSNCKNCGGRLPLPEEASAFDESAPPPAPPRDISGNYVWRLLTTDGWAIVAIVFALLGIVFAPLGVILTIAVITIFVGIPFVMLGTVFLTSGVAVLVWRYQLAHMTVNVLRNGHATRGKIVDVEQIYNVSINGRNPWFIKYQFTLDGDTYTGQISTLDEPHEQLAKGYSAWVLYLPTAPQNHTLYPHP